MKLLLGLIVLMFSIQLSAQCQKQCEQCPYATMSTIENNQSMEDFDEVFLFKNSSAYFVLKCKQECVANTCDRRKIKQNSFSNDKCSLDKVQENLGRKNTFAGK